MSEVGEKFQSQQKEGGFGKGEKTFRVVEGSVVRPAGQASRVLEAGRSLVPQRDSGQTGNWFDQKLPYEELVDNIQVLVDRARARHLPTHPDPFNPAEWLGEELLVMARDHHDGADQQRYLDLLTAWDALTYTRYTSGSDETVKWSEQVRQRLENHVQDTKQTSLTLSPQSVKVLDAMAEVAGIPRKNGEATIDLTPFTQRYSWRQENTWFEQDKPYDELVGEMRQFARRAQARYPQTDTEQFNPASAFGTYLERLAGQGHADQQRYIDLFVAWEALAYTRYPAAGVTQRIKEDGRSQLEGHVRFYKRASFTLSHESARVLDAMAEVAGIPRKRGETKIDLTPFVRPNNKTQPLLTGK